MQSYFQKVLNKKFQLVIYMFYIIFPYLFTYFFLKNTLYLFKGNARDSQDVDLIRQLNVTHIINVTDSLPMPFRKLNRIQYLHIPASDTTKQNLLPSFDRAVQFIGIFYFFLYISVWLKEICCSRGDICIYIFRKISYISIGLWGLLSFG